MENNRIQKKTISEIPIGFTRSSYAAHYNKKKLMKSSKSIPISPEKPTSVDVITVLKSNANFEIKKKVKLTDISSIKGESTNFSFDSTLDDLGNIFNQPKKNILNSKIAFWDNEQDNKNYK